MKTYTTMNDDRDLVVYTGIHAMTMINKSIEIEPWIQRVTSLFVHWLPDESHHEKALKRDLNADDNDRVNIAKVALILKEKRWD